jgi:hypothetical protein
MQKPDKCKKNRRTHKLMELFGDQARGRSLGCATPENVGIVFGLAILGKPVLRGVFARMVEPAPTQ